jgi:hypothetical protein
MGQCHTYLRDWVGRRREPRIVVVYGELSVLLAVIGNVPTSVQVLPSLARQIIKQSRLVVIAEGCEDLLLGTWQCVDRSAAIEKDGGLSCVA